MEIKKKPLTEDLVSDLIRRGKSPADVAGLMRVSRRRINDYCRQGRLGYYIRGRYYIAPEEAKKFKPNDNGRPLSLHEELPLDKVGEVVKLSVSQVRRLVTSGVMGWQDSRQRCHVTKMDCLRYLSGHDKSYYQEQLSVSAAAGLLGKTQTEVVKLVKNGLLPSCETDEGAKITRQDVMRFLHSQ